MSTPISTLRLQDAWRECERNAYHLQRALSLLQPAQSMVGVLVAIEKKLRQEHPALNLAGSVS